MKKTTKKKLGIILLFFLMATCCFFACASPVVYAPKSIDLFVTDKVELSAVVVPFGSTDSIKFSSSNPSVADIDEHGIITAISAGTSIISSKIQGSTAKTTVNVFLPAEEIRVDTSPIYVSFEDRVPLRPLTVIPENAVAVVNWEIKDPEIADIRVYALTGPVIEGFAYGITEIIGTDLRTGQTVSYPIIVADGEVLRALSPEKGLKIHKISVEEDSYYIFDAGLPDEAYLEYLTKFGAVPTADKKTWYLSSDLKDSFPSNKFGIVIKIGEDKTEVSVYKQVPIDVLIDPQFYLPECVQIFYADHGSGGLYRYRTLGASAKSREELLAAFVELYGQPIVMPALNNKDIQYIYKIDQRSDKWVVDTTDAFWNFVITIESYNGVSFIETKIIRFIGQAEKLPNCPIAFNNAAFLPECDLTRGIYRVYFAGNKQSYEGVAAKYEEMFEMQLKRLDEIYMSQEYYGAEEGLRYVGKQGENGIDITIILYDGFFEIVVEVSPLRVLREDLINALPADTENIVIQSFGNTEFGYKICFYYLNDSVTDYISGLGSISNISAEMYQKQADGIWLVAILITA